MGFNASLETGETVYIVSKVMESNQVELLTDQNGREYYIGVKGLIPKPSAVQPTAEPTQEATVDPDAVSERQDTTITEPTPEVEVVTEPEAVDPLAFPASDEGASAYHQAVEAAVELDAAITEPETAPEVESADAAA